MEIIDGQRNFGERSVYRVISHPDSPHRRMARSVGVNIPSINVGSIAVDHPVVARVYCNMWVADCPDCTNAEFVFFDEPYFWCAACQNSVVGHKWRPVELPQDRHAIEEVLRARPLPKNRNWNPDETVDDLQRQNIAKGLPGMHPVGP